ncbi:MAG: hypothetical protein KF749_05935 [Bacteroidetes bacterium]|nr:hypothetical protein [Bacteroidota bacterium]MCW5894675.1 hypothetical protein [Bacteroidota bacterium]
MIREILSNRNTAIPAAIYLVVSLVCTHLPLLNYLGYEFSAVIALLASFISGFLTIRAVKGSLSESAVNPQSSSAALAFNSFKQALVFNLSLLIIPLIVMLTNALFVKNCSLIEGFGFFVLIPVVSVLFSSAFGFFCAAHYHWPRTLFVLFVLAMFAEVLAVGYFTPAIFSYNFFYGYFPGLTYDEVLGISSSLVMFRILTLLLAGALVWMALLILRSTHPDDASWEKGLSLLGAMMQGRSVFVTAALATLVIVTWWFRGELGFDSSSNFIRRSLGEAIETQHFRIYYAKQSYDKSEIRWIAAEHEFRLKQITDEFNLSYKGKIESFIYPSSEVKQRLMGAGNTNIAKPWSQQIHLTKQSLDATLKHELVHVVAAPFGLPIIKASLSTGLVEGLAMAIEWEWGSRTPHEYAAAMRRFGVGPDISSIMSLTGFAAQSSSISYVLAGSFCRYLIDTYGIRNMMLLYRSNEYERMYGKGLDSLVAEWRTFLEGIPVTDQDRDVVDVLFRRPPIFQKVCARVIAARNALARKKFSGKKYDEAYALYDASFKETLSYESLSGLLSSSLRLGNYDVLSSALDTIILKNEKPAQYLPLFLTIGDGLWRKGDTLRALQLYRRLERADLSAGLTEAVRLRQHASSEEEERWRLYFLSDENDTIRAGKLSLAVQQSPGSWLPHYMLAKPLVRLHRFDEAQTILHSFALESVDSVLECSRLRMLGYSLFRLKRFEEAKAVFWRSLNFVAGEAARNEIHDWLERIDWAKKFFTQHQ